MVYLIHELHIEHKNRRQVIYGAVLDDEILSYIKIKCIENDYQQVNSYKFPEVMNMLLSGCNLYVDLKEYLQIWFYTTHENSITFNYIPVIFLRKILRRKFLTVNAKPSKNCVRYYGHFDDFILKEEYLDVLQNIKYYAIDSNLMHFCDHNRMVMFTYISKKLNVLKSY